MTTTTNESELISRDVAAFRAGLAIREADEAINQVRAARSPIDAALGRLQASIPAVAKALADAWLATLPKVTFNAVEALNKDQLKLTAFTDRLRTYADRLRHSGKAASDAERRAASARGAERADVEAWTEADATSLRAKKKDLQELDLMPDYGKIRARHQQMRFSPRSTLEWWWAPFIVACVCVPIDWVIRLPLVATVAIIGYVRVAEYFFQKRAATQAAKVLLGGGDLSSYLRWHDLLQAQHDALEKRLAAKHKATADRIACEQIEKVTAATFKRDQADFANSVARDLERVFTESWQRDGDEPWTRKVLLGWPAATRRPAFEMLLIHEQIDAFRKARASLDQEMTELGKFKGAATGAKSQFARLSPKRTVNSARIDTLANGLSTRRRLRTDRLISGIGQFHDRLYDVGFEYARRDWLDRFVVDAIDIAQAVPPELVAEAVDQGLQVAGEMVGTADRLLGAGLDGATDIVQRAAEEAQEGVDAMLKTSVVAFALQGIEDTGTAVHDAFGAVGDSVHGVAEWFGLADGTAGAPASDEAVGGVDASIDGGSDASFSIDAPSFTDWGRDADGSDAGSGGGSGSEDTDDRRNAADDAGGSSSGWGSDTSNDRDDRSSNDDNDRGSDDSANDPPDAPDTDSGDSGDSDDSSSDD